MLWGVSLLFCLVITDLYKCASLELGTLLYGVGWISLCPKQTMLIICKSAMWWWEVVVLQAWSKSSVEDVVSGLVLFHTAASSQTTSLSVSFFCDSSYYIIVSTRNTWRQTLKHTIHETTTPSLSLQPPASVMFRINKPIMRPVTYIKQNAFTYLFIYLLLDK